MACCIDGCDRSVKSRGLCDKHYLFFLRKGDLDKFVGPGRGRHAPVQRRECAGVSECGKALLARGLCQACYQYRKANGLLTNKPAVNVGKQCKCVGCKNPAQAIGYCVTHYEKIRKYGDPLGKAPVLTGGKCSNCHGTVVAKGLCGTCYARLQKHGSPNGFSQRHLKRGSDRVDGDGYVQMYKPDHPNARKSGHITKHRFVMSKVLGRALLEGENVHHKNGVRSNNSRRNLELWVTTQPCGQRPRDLVDWAREILRRYPADVIKRLK